MYLKIYFPAKNMNEKLETKIPIIRNVIDTIEYFHKYYSRTLKKKEKKTSHFSFFSFSRK